MKLETKILAKLVIFIVANNKKYVSIATPRITISILHVTYAHQKLVQTNMSSQNFIHKLQLRDTMLYDLDYNTASRFITASVIQYLSKCRCYLPVYLLSQP